MSQAGLRTASAQRPDVAGRMATLLDGGHLDLPLPGSGRTRERLVRLRDLGSADLVTARLAEAHTDALAILSDLGTPDPSGDRDGPEGEVGQRHLWGVWAADPPQTPLRATLRIGSGWSLSGDKPWCSGAGVCTRALVTAHTDQGYRLFAVDPRHPGVTVRPSSWVGTGMSGSDTRDLELLDVPARPVGPVGAYLDRPGFWWGAAGVAAVWLGGALRVSRALERSAGRHGRDLVLASLGRVDAAQHAAWCTLLEVARLADGTDGSGADRSTGADGTADGWPADDVPGMDLPGRDLAAAARLAAARARAAVETAVEVTLHETGRATGPGPLATDAEHARAVADLQVYVRQSHGDRDLAVLGGLALTARTQGRP